MMLELVSGYVINTNSIEFINRTSINHAGQPKSVIYIHFTSGKKIVAHEQDVKNILGIGYKLKLFNTED